MLGQAAHGRHQVHTLMGAQHALLPDGQVAHGHVPQSVSDGQTVQAPLTRWQELSFPTQQVWLQLFPETSWQQWFERQSLF
jgi:hypothetical protein